MDGAREVDPDDPDEQVSARTHFASSGCRRKHMSLPTSEDAANAGLYVMLSRAHAEFVRLYSDVQQERAAAQPTREHEARSTEPVWLS